MAEESRMDTETENHESNISEESEVSSTISSNDNSIYYERPKSKFKIFFENLNYRLSYTPALGFVGVMSIVCFLGFLFFTTERNHYLNNDNLELANSCLVFQVFFCVTAIIFIILFISSIVLNIIRRNKGKR